MHRDGLVEVAAWVATRILSDRARSPNSWPILNPQATTQLEFHQLDRRWEHLRARQPQRERQLMASLAESGQQTPIVVVLAPDQQDRYLPAP